MMTDAGSLSQPVMRGRSKALRECMDPRLKDPPVFIVGMPRSGTTLVSMILNGHSRICITPETHYFDKFYRKGERRGCTADEAAFERFVAYVTESSNIQQMGFTAEERSQLAEKILATGRRSHAVVLGTLLASYAATQEKSIVGEKTPKHILYTDAIFDAFPQARILHVVRDPRDVILSLRKVDWEVGNMLEHLGQWKQAIRVGMHAARVHAGRLMVVRYEDVLESPEQTVRDVCDFLGVAFEPAMLAYHEHTPANFDVKLEPWKVKNLQPIDAQNRMKWKTLMSANDCALVEARAGEEMAALGYPLVMLGLDGGARLRLGYLSVENALLHGSNLLQRVWLRLRERYG